MGLRGGLRLILVMLSWFVIVPLATSFTFYMYFGRPAYEFSIRQLRFSYPLMLYPSHKTNEQTNLTSDRGFMTDCAFGTFISAIIIFLCLLIMSLMDFVNNMHVMEHNRVPEVENQNPNNNQNQNNQNNIQPNGNNIDGNEVVGAPDLVGEDEEDNEDEEDQIAQYNEVLDQINNLNHPEFHIPPPVPVAGPANVAAAGAGVEDVVEEDDGVINNMLFGFLDGNAGEVDFNELVGVVGPLAGLISKVIALILFNACFLALFALIPLVLGRFILQVCFKITCSPNS